MVKHAYVSCNIINRKYEPYTTRRIIMQKVSFSFPPEVIDQLDHERGSLSRNQFVLRLLTNALREHQERTLHRITAEVYADGKFAREEERLAEDFFEASPGTEQ